MATPARPRRNLDRQDLSELPVTTAAATTYGWTRSAQRHAVGTGDLVRIRRSVLACAPWIDEAAAGRVGLEAAILQSARASTLTCSRAVISHSSAAIAIGIPTYGDLARACLTVPAGTALRDLAHAHLHRASVSIREVQVLDGFRVTASARTVLDIARERGSDAGVVAADFALRERLTSIADLREELQLCTRWPGAKAARATVLLADARSESVLESLSRLRIMSGPLPPPEPQTLIYDRQGRFLGRCDFYWDELGVIGEADGDIKYRVGRAAVDAQVDRQTALEGTGLSVVRWGWSDLYDFAVVERRIERAAARRRLQRSRRSWIAVPA